MDSFMNFFVSDAWAQAGGQGQGGGMIGLIFPIALLAIFYFLMIRPQQKRAKEHKAMVEALKKGDEVVTNGGLLGRISEVGDNFVLMEAAEGINLKVQKQSVAGVMPKGTTKGL